MRNIDQRHKILLIMLSICVALSTILFQAKPSYAFDFEKEIDRIFSMPDDEIDMGIAALLVAKDLYPDLDIKTYLDKIDGIVAGAKYITQGNKDPDYRVRAMNTFLYKYVGIEYDLSDPYTEKLENRYLNGIIDTKKGSCATMPLLYLVVAQRLGYPVYGVQAPWHYFVRYVDPKLQQQNIEATGGGGYSPDEEYIEKFQITERSIKSGAYLRTMTNREYLANLVAGNAVQWNRRGDYERAIRYLAKCVRVNPRSADIVKLFGGTYLLYSKKFTGQRAEEYRWLGECFLMKADEMGVTETSNENYMKEIKKFQEQYRKKHREG